MDKQAEHVRDRLIVRTSLVAIGTNLCLVAFKMAVGLLANSIAIVLDAMNNLSDALSSVITILGTKLAGRPPDKKHPFGYGRMEYLTGILIAGIILFAGVNFAVTSVQKIITPDLPHYSLLTVGDRRRSHCHQTAAGRLYQKNGPKDRLRRPGGLRDRRHL